MNRFRGSEASELANRYRSESPSSLTATSAGVGRHHYDEASFAVAPPANMSNNQSRNGTPTPVMPGVSGGSLISAQNSVPHSPANFQPQVAEMEAGVQTPNAHIDSAQPATVDSGLGHIQRRMNRQQRRSRSSAPSRSATPHDAADGSDAPQQREGPPSCGAGDAVLIVDDGPVVSAPMPVHGVPADVSPLPSQGGKCLCFFKTK
jgi:hypothetical protein